MVKRLDDLTQEEAQMAAAQGLKAVHAVDDTGRVRGVADIALGVNNRVAVISDQVQVVSDQVQSANDNVTAAIDGAWYITQNAPRSKKGHHTIVIQQVADDVDQANRS